MLIVGIDFETHSAANLRMVGPWAYARHASTKPLMMAWKPFFQQTHIRMWLLGDSFPDELWQLLCQGAYVSGWNSANFERLIWKLICAPRMGWPEMPEDRWLDSMHLAAGANLPRSLDGAARAVGADVQKDNAGHNLMMKLTQENRTPWERLKWVYAPPDQDRFVLAADPKAKVWLPQLRTEWENFKSYCRTDVGTEEATAMGLPGWHVAEPWPRMPLVDRRINDRGILIDIPLVQGMLTAADAEGKRLDAEMRQVTNGVVKACTTIEALKKWLLDQGTVLQVADDSEKDADEDEEAEEDAEMAPEAEEGVIVPAAAPDPAKPVRYRMRATDIIDLLQSVLPGDYEPWPRIEDQPVLGATRRTLEMRHEAAKASTKKLKKILASVCPDGRLRGVQILHGAQQTGRFTSGGAQVYNFIRNVIPHPDVVEKDLEKTRGRKPTKHEVHAQTEYAMRGAILDGRSGSADQIRSCWGPVLPFISRMLRRTVSAPVGHVLVQADWKSIEAILTSWISGQQNMVEAWRGTIAGGADVYKIQAAAIAGVPVEQVTKEQRQLGKVSILACGFGGGPNALNRMAFNYGIKLSVDDQKTVVQKYRESNPQTRAFWYAVADAAMMAVLYPGREFHVEPLGLVSYFMNGNRLCARLPSGRLLSYWAPRIEPPKEDWMRPSISALHCKGSAVFRRSTWHGTLVENLCQSLGVDLLARSLDRMDQEGMQTVLHVYDSIANEAPEHKADEVMRRMVQIMTDPVPWAPGLPIGVDAHYSARFG